MATEALREIEVEYTRPWMYPKQLAAIFGPERYSVVEATTKSGKTVSCMAWLLEQGLQGKPGHNFWWVAPTYPQAEIAYRRIKRGIPHTIYSPNESKLSIELLNGCVLWFKSAEKPDNLYGEDVYAAVIDEASRCREESWHAVRSTLTATRGPVRIIGNIRGRKNWAYRLARRAESGEPGMHYAKITAYDAVEAGILSAEEVEDAKRQLPEAVFRELYLAEASDDEGNPFGIAAIRECLGPLSTDPPVVFGVDLAKSVDWTAIVGLDAQNRVCRFERFQLPWQTTIERIKAIVGDAAAYVDSTGVGDPIVEALQAAGGPYYRGFKFSSQSKQQIMEGLAVAIQHRSLIFPEGEISRELENFEFVYSRSGVRYSAPEGLHDDCVCALALAVHGTRSAHEWQVSEFLI